MSGMHPDTDKYPVGVFALDGVTYWYQRVPRIQRRVVELEHGVAVLKEQHGMETRVAELGTDQCVDVTPSMEAQIQHEEQKYRRHHAS